MKVLVIGEVLVEIMRPLVGVSLGERSSFIGPYPSGAPAIFIYNLTTLGSEGGIISKVGQDVFGDLCVNHLEMSGVDVSCLKKTDIPTGVAFVTYYKDGSRDFLYHIRNAACAHVTDADIHDKWIDEYDWIHINGSSLCMNQSMRDVNLRVAKKMKEKGGIVSFDPNIRPELMVSQSISTTIHDILLLCDYIMPSTGEELIITGKTNREEAINALLNYGIKQVFLKLGKNGSVAYSHNKIDFVPAFNIEEKDATGAGDSYCAAIVYGLIKRWEGQKLLTFANGLGAIAASHVGPMEWKMNERDVWNCIKKYKV
ncbi:sugar kinase [Halalkalibacter sp. AB-rgal2]|uniref:sugar kinase n=1 Tax=Halalkalibacter sp. AB-rgal2 TaxID=3242695 RepID=UPI00359EE7F5